MAERRDRGASGLDRLAPTFFWRATNHDQRGHHHRKHAAGPQG
jgi:hypothetical protein